MPLIGTSAWCCRVKQQEGMRRMSKVFVFLKNESGATAIEYGLIAAGISVAIIAAVTTVGRNLQTTFNRVGNALAG
jgi:pilus assembly protein Flp/PilA